ncbi:L-histidine N(alpha)-methyltransferase [Nannocystaceae bacterium ST9]
MTEHGRMRTGPARPRPRDPRASEPLAMPAIARVSAQRSFAEDVVLGLSSVPKHLPCKYFYDVEGSRLFDRITELPEYYPTRTELALMRTHVAAMARAIGPGALVVELGSGSSVKTRLLLAALERPVGYVPVDISTEHLHASALALAHDYPELEILPVAADFTHGFALPRTTRTPTRVLVYFPGSTIGNFAAEQARALLEAIAALLVPQGDARAGALLLGFDRVKASALLERAYADAAGVTADFNLNLLARINRELEGDFDLASFRHRATWVPEPARIEMHLDSLRDQVVHAAGETFHFAAGEAILTEHSHKYTELRMLELTRAAGLRRARLWTDHDEHFGVGLFEP